MTRKEYGAIALAIKHAKLDHTGHPDDIVYAMVNRIAGVISRTSSGFDWDQFESDSGIAVQVVNLSTD